MQRSTAEVGLILALALLLSACGAESSQASSTTSTSTTTTTAPSTTTTTTVPGPIPIFPTTNFDADKRYAGTLASGLDYQLFFPGEGWEVEVIGQQLQQFVHFTNLSSDRPSAEVGLVLFNAQDSVDDVVKFFLDHENIIETTEPTRVTVAGLDAQTLDVLVGPGPSGGAGPNSPCLQRVGLASDRVQDGNVWVEEVLGCAWSRIWVIDVDGITVTIYGSRQFNELDPEAIAEIEPVEPLLDDFISAIIFCTEATPCDD